MPHRRKPLEPADPCEDDPRTECYSLIAQRVREQIEAYYHKFRDRLGDERSGDAIHYSHEGLKTAVFGTLDEFEITRKRA